MDDTLRDVLIWVVAAPLVFGTLASILIAGAGRAAPAGYRQRVSLIAGAMGAFAAVGLVALAAWRLFGRPVWPPRESLHYLLHAACIALPLSLLPITLRTTQGRWITLFVAIVCAVIATYFIVPRFTWAGWGLVIWPLLLATVRTLDPARREVMLSTPAGVSGTVVAEWRSGITPIVLAGTLCASVAVCLAATGSLKLAKLAGVLAFVWLGLLAGTCTAGKLFAAGAGGETGRRALLGVTSAFIACLLGQGVHLGSTDGSTVLMLYAGVCAAVMAGTIQLPWVCGWKRDALVGLEMLFFAGLAALIAFARYKAANPADDYGY